MRRNRRPRGLSWPSRCSYRQYAASSLPRGRRGPHFSFRALPRRFSGSGILRAGQERGLEKPRPLFSVARRAFSLSCWSRKTWNLLSARKDGPSYSMTPRFALVALLAAEIEPPGVLREITSVTRSGAPFGPCLIHDAEALLANEIEVRLKDVYPNRAAHQMAP